jgi:hypothetical protein
MDFQYLMVGETGRGVAPGSILVAETAPATVQLPAIGELKQGFDVIFSLHVQVRHLIDAAAPITVVPHTKMPTANNAGELNILQQHIVAVSSVASPEFLSSLTKAGVLAIHLAIEKTGPQGFDKINHNGVKLVLRAFQGADAAGVLKVGQVRRLFLTARNKTEWGGRESLGDCAPYVAAIGADKA